MEIATLPVSAVRSNYEGRHLSHAQVIPCEAGYEVRVYARLHGIFQVGQAKKPHIPRHWKTASAALKFVQFQFGHIPVVVMPHTQAKEKNHEVPEHL